MVDLPGIQRISRLTPLADALASIERLVTPVRSRGIALAVARGRTLASDILVKQPHPAAALALRDGVAVSADVTLDATSYAPVRLAGEPAFVEVGDALPAGADAVAPLEGIELRGEAVHALTPVAPGDGVLPHGADVALGDVLARAGTRLRVSDLAAMAALGMTHVPVCQPRVAIVAARPNPDAIIAAAVGLLLHSSADAGAHAAVAPSSAPEEALDDARKDAVIVVGGSGSGRRDRVVAELARRGSVAFHGVGLSPGETTAFGMIERRPVLVVPGRLDAALAVSLTLGRRMLARLTGCTDREPTETVVLTRKISSTLGLAELVPVEREKDGVASLGSSYLSFQSLARAGGYVIVPPDREGFPAGTRVEMRPLP